MYLTNDERPRVRCLWKRGKTPIGRGASNAANANVLYGATIGVGAMVGADAVVTRDLQSGATMAGNPATVVNP